MRKNADLNTSAALAVVFDVMTWSRNQLSWMPASILALKEMIAMIRRTFGCFDPEEMDLPADVLTLLTKREEARKSKDFHRSDLLRDDILKCGYEVKDTSGGQKLRKI